MCEIGCLFGWKYMAEKLTEIITECENNHAPSDGTLACLKTEINRIADKQNYFHYFDIRTNHLNEKDWRRSFSINQLLYGMILYTAKNGDFETFDEILEHLEGLYGNK